LGIEANKKIEGMRGIKDGDREITNR